MLPSSTPYMCELRESQQISEMKGLKKNMCKVGSANHHVRSRGLDG